MKNCVFSWSHSFFYYYTFTFVVRLLGSLMAVVSNTVNTQRFPFSNILAVMLLVVFLFISSKVLAVLDWELSTLGEDLKYYATYTYAILWSAVSCIFSLKAFNNTAILELRICLLLRVVTPVLSLTVAFTLKKMTYFYKYYQFRLICFLFLLFFWQKNLFRAGDPLSDIAYMCLAHYIPADSPMLR